MFSYRVPKVLRRSYPSCLWNYSRSTGKVFLTFDDGPHPDTTPHILKMLREEGVKATFFCVGENVERYPHLYEQILEEGHIVGNHSHNHLNGFKTKTGAYLDNIEQAGQLIESDLFRPPYGRIKLNQVRKLKKNYKIIMYSLVVRDWDQSHTKEQCYFVVRNKLKPGDIVVLHDSVKAFDRMIFTLEKTIEYVKERKLKFGTIK